MTETLEVVDLCLPGLNCPMPVLRAKKALAKMAGGTLLRVVSTSAWRPLREFLDAVILRRMSSAKEENVHRRAFVTDEAAGEYVTVIRRRED